MLGLTYNIQAQLLVRSFSMAKKPTTKFALLGKKVGMTQIFDANGDVIPVTVVEAGPCVVLQKKTTETDGYSAVQLGFDYKKNKKF